MGRSRRKKNRYRGADRQLSQHDLSQIDEAYLLGLAPERLRTLSVKLLADLKAAHERLNQNPRNLL